jgi:hypothetical protein
MTRFEPEVIRSMAEHLQYEDGERELTRPLQAVEAHGVALSGQSLTAEELEIMVLMVEAVDLRLRGVIAAIGCEGKAPHSYVVTLKAAFSRVAQLIAPRLLEAAGTQSRIILQDPSGGKLYELSGDSSADG